MSQPQPIQPNQAQYPISLLNLFPVYATRSAYQQASGQQAPPFDPAQPVKGWADPAPDGQPYVVFDPGALVSGYVSQLAVPAAQASKVNLPGTYVYPSYVTLPTDAMQVGPYGPIGQVSPDQVCLQSDAQKIADEIAPLFPGQPISVLQEKTAVFQYVYGNDPRRQWFIQVGNTVYLAQTLIEMKNAHGVGAPGHWTLGTAGLVWTYDAPVTAAPANAVNLPAPIRPLLPNEQIVHLPGSPFNQAGSWVVERADLPQAQTQETTDQQFANVKASLAAIQTALDAIRAKLGA